MSFSYKPVLLKAMLEHVDENGRVRVEDIVKFTVLFPHNMYRHSRREYS